MSLWIQEVKKHFGYIADDMVKYMKNKGYVAFMSRWSKFDHYYSPTDIEPNTVYLSFSKYKKRIMYIGETLYLYQRVNLKYFGITQSGFEAISKAKDQNIKECLN